MLGKMDTCTSEPRPLSYVILKNQFKMDDIFKHRSQIIKFLKENIGGTFFDKDLGNDFLDSTTKAKTTKLSK